MSPERVDAAFGMLETELKRSEAWRADLAKLDDEVKQAKDAWYTRENELFKRTYEFHPLRAVWRLLSGGKAPVSLSDAAHFRRTNKDDELVDLFFQGKVAEERRNRVKYAGPLKDWQALAKEDVAKQLGVDANAAYLPGSTKPASPVHYATADDYLPDGSWRWETKPKAYYGDTWTVKDPSKAGPTYTPPEGYSSAPSASVDRLPTYYETHLPDQVPAGGARTPEKTWGDNFYDDMDAIAGATKKAYNRVRFQQDRMRESAYNSRITHPERSFSAMGDISDSERAMSDIHRSSLFDDTQDTWSMFDDIERGTLGTAEGSFSRARTMTKAVERHGRVASVADNLDASHDFTFNGFASGYGVKTFQGQATLPDGRRVNGFANDMGHFSGQIYDSNGKRVFNGNDWGHKDIYEEIKKGITDVVDGSDRANGFVGGNGMMGQIGTSDGGAGVGWGLGSHNKVNGFINGPEGDNWLHMEKFHDRVEAGDVRTTGFVKGSDGSTSVRNENNVWE